jgi:hypothetical protein
MFILEFQLLISIQQVLIIQFIMLILLLQLRNDQNPFISLSLHDVHFSKKNLHGLLVFEVKDLLPFGVYFLALIVGYCDFMSQGRDFRSECCELNFFFL